MTRRTASGLLAWLLAVALATGVGIAAVSVIGDGIVGSGPQPLSQSEVDNAQFTPPATTTGTSTSDATTPPGSTSTGTTAPDDSAKVFPMQGGTVSVRCTGGLVEIVAAVPGQGYQVEADREADDHPKVRFRSGKDDVEARFRCVGGVPQIERKR